MKKMFIIEDRVFFRPEDGTLWLTDREEEKVILPPIVARLLTLLLEEQGKVMTREELMERVWTVHGLEPSGNSLNQYISNIRRNMQNLGLGENVIRTLPRIGFILNAEIKVEKADITVPAITPPADVNTTEIFSAKKRTQPGKIMAMMIVFIFILAGTPFIVEEAVDQYHNRQLSAAPVFIGKIGSCAVYGVMMDNLARLPDTFSLAKTLVKRENIQCKDQDIVLMNIQDSVYHQEDGRVFISVCNQIAGRLAACRNHLFNSWR
jgi:DNA-binding winged helix-turn-helix (wHTH) protein